MSVGDLLRLPPAVQVAFVVMLWPAIWAAAAMVMALVADILRRQRRAQQGTRDELLQDR